MTARVHITGPDLRTTVDLDRDVVTIGRHSTVTIHLPDLRVSSAHCVLQEVAGRWRIEDLGSTNGTTVDRHRLVPHEPREMQDGAQIEIGPYVLEFRQAGVIERTVPEARRNVDLTPTEQDVLEKLFVHFDTADGPRRLATNREIAELRFVSAEAVKLVLRGLYAKFELHDPDERNREALAARAQEWGMTKRRY